MSTALTPATGARIHIGASSVTAETLAAFDALADWKEIGMVESIPEFGTKWETGNFTPVADGLKRKFKTMRDNGSLQITAARVGDDEGQKAAIAAASDSNHSYPIKVVLNDDTGTGAGHKPSRYYFYALITSATVNPGAAGDTVKTTIGLEITSEIVEGEQADGA